MIVIYNRCVKPCYYYYYHRRTMCAICPGSFTAAFPNFLDYSKKDDNFSTTKDSTIVHLLKKVIASYLKLSFEPLRCILL